MYKFSKYKEQYRENLKLAMPVMLSQLGHIIVQIADNAMVGRYGGDDPIPLAAAAFGGGVFFIAFVSIMGLTLGITPLVGELYAKCDRRGASMYLKNSLILYGLIAFVATILQYLFIPALNHMGQPQEVVEMAIPYYKTLVWSLIPAILFFVFKQFFEGVGNTKVAMYAVIASNFVNIGLNYLLIGGELGAPELGVLGAGVATLSARVVMAIIIVAYFLMNRELKVYRSLYALCHYSRQSIVRLFKMGFPIAIQIMLEAGVFVVLGVMFGWFGAAAISAHQIGLVLGNCSFMMIIAIGSATTIRISHCYGREEWDVMRLASNAGWHLALVGNIIAAIVYFSFRELIPQIFTSNEEVIHIASVLILTIVAYQIPDGIQCVGVGILRGMHDVNMIPAIAFISYWVLNIPIAYLCAFTFGFGVTGLYMGLFTGFAAASGLIIWRIKRRQRILMERSVEKL